MADLNKWIGMGNLTRDIDIRFTPGGTAVCDMNLAVNRKTKEKSETLFITVIVWGAQAEACEKYLAKGSPVLVEGRLILETWEDKHDGSKRQRIKVNGERIQFLGKPRKQEKQDESEGYAEEADPTPDGAPPVERDPAEATPGEQHDNGPGDDMSDSLPF